MTCDMFFLTIQRLASRFESNTVRSLRVPGALLEAQNHTKMIDFALGSRGLRVPGALLEALAQLRTTRKW